MNTSAIPLNESGRMTSDERKIIFASSLGTVFEWYDFYLYGSLAAVVGKQFFSSVNETAAFIFALLAFAAGFAVRPFGALVFGRLGDLVGRKYTFLVTILLMGTSTFLVGVLPSYASIGITAPVLLIVLRLVQGLALGGEYGGAATYVAEHAPGHKRGGYTAWIQTTATLGFFLSLLVILGTRLIAGESAFADWAWRIPFVFSVILVSISVWIRMTLSESPVFLKMKAENTTSKAPIKEAFGEWKNVRLVLIALFGVVAGQAVIWYAGQFYALFFLTQTLKVNPVTANLMIAAALLIGTPMIVFFGSLSDRVGRKPVMLLGFLLAIVFYFPIFHGLTKFANPTLYAAQESAPVTVVADPTSCSFQFNPVGTSSFSKSCDIAKSFLARSAVNYSNENAPAGTVAYVRVGNTRIDSVDIAGVGNKEGAKQVRDFEAKLGTLIKSVGYPTIADPKLINYPMVLLMLIGLVLTVAMVYGPIAATLVELFPTRIRYTAMSLPYHIGNGWFGGFLPTTAFALVAATGNIYAGVWYPVVIAAVSLVIGFFFLPETRQRRIID
ncbi:MFS transporter (plasmid) [Paraburkholderia largidicola]|uniref:MFS transporter n=3 Tax=Paraburkholderia TaxID=1822464 RepID=A0A7I8C0W0_9BURK|nr:MFS transporter [Paraburkholderia sp. PGU16]GJH36167.1 MFS transporter [Paraburkholderia hospita]